MKLSEIEAKYEGDDYGQPLYDEQQMQEYAKARVYEALYKHTSFGTGKEGLVKHMTEELFAENIFEEDTKND